MAFRIAQKVAGFGFAVAALAVTVSATSFLANKAIAADDHAAHATDGLAATSSALDAGRVAKGRDLFNNWSCSACHTLADAKAAGAVGPSFDGHEGLTEDFITGKVTNGQGAMPAFGGQLTKEEIADLAYYVSHVAAK